MTPNEAKAFLKQHLPGWQKLSAIERRRAVDGLDATLKQPVRQALAAAAAPAKKEA